VAGVGFWAVAVRLRAVAAKARNARRERRCFMKNSGEKMYVSIDVGWVELAR
jgi:hypothetical protein